MQTRQKVLIIAVLLVAIVAIIGFTLAYFTDSASTTGQISTKDFSIKITQNLSSITNWNPGDNNNVSFKYAADGSNSAITRFRLKLNFNNANLISHLAGENSLLVNFVDGNGTSSSLTKIADGQYVSNWYVNPVILSGNTQKDGEDELTASFQIGLASAAGNIYQDVDFTVIAEVEAVQARNTVLNSDGTSKGLTASEIMAIFTDAATVARTQTGEIVKAN